MTPRPPATSPGQQSAPAEQSAIQEAFARLRAALGPCGAHDEEVERFARALTKHERRQSFRLERALNDKTIAVRLLDQTIADLRRRSSDLEKNEQHLSDSVAQLRLVNDDMQHFMHVASHDLKTPLRSIGSFASLIARRYGEALPAEADEYFGYIRQAALAMNRVIDDLVHYNASSHLDTTEQVDLNEVCNEVLLNLHADLDEAGGKVEVGELGQATVPRSAVSQLLQNLIRNALVYRSAERVAHIVVSRLPGEELLLSIADNGVGLSNEYADKAFAPFKRVGDVSRPGTGMGLAICRRIARQLGGDVTYEGVVGQGTTFYVRIAHTATG